MKAIQLNQYGDYSQLKLVNVPEPKPTGHQVVVKVTAAAVNPLDNTVRLGQFPMAKKPPLILGNEGAGRVVDPRDSGLAEGTRVMFSGTYGVLRDGTWQEYLLVEPYHLVKIPEMISDIEAAAVPVAFLTGQLALTAAGGFHPGQYVLVPGVGSSVGNAALQLARAQGANRVITSSGSTTKAETARSLGYSDVIDLSKESLSSGVARLTDGIGVDLALDCIGGPITGQALACLKQGGTLVSIGYSAGTQAEINVLDLIGKATRITGFNLFLQPPDAMNEAFKVIMNLLTEGKIRPVIAKTFPLAQAAEAQRYLIENRPFGKVVLTI